MDLKQFLNDLKQKRVLRMIDESPLILRNAKEHRILNHYISKVKEKQNKTLIQLFEMSREKPEEEVEESGESGRKSPRKKTRQLKKKRQGFLINSSQILSMMHNSISSDHRKSSHTNMKRDSELNRTSQGELSTEVREMQGSLGRLQPMMKEKSMNPNLDTGRIKLSDLKKGVTMDLECKKSISFHHLDSNRMDEALENLQPYKDNPKIQTLLGVETAQKVQKSNPLLTLNSNKKSRNQNDLRLKRTQADTSQNQSLQKSKRSGSNNKTFLRKYALTKNAQLDASNASFAKTFKDSEVTFDHQARAKSSENPRPRSFIRKKKFRVMYPLASICPKGCVTCGGRNTSVEYHEERHVCYRCQRSLVSADDGSYVDVFLGMNGQITVLKKSQQNDGLPKRLFLSQQGELLQQLRERIKANKDGDKKNLIGQLYPKGFNYGHYMHMKIFGMGCYASFAGENQLVVLLKDTNHRIVL